jgi:hypothetical protein
MSEEISQLGKDLRAIREEILAEERMSNTDNDTPKPAENGPLDLAEQVALKMGWKKDIDVETSDWFWVDETGHTACNLDICINYTPAFDRDETAAFQVVRFIHSKGYWTKLLSHYSPENNHQFMIGAKAEQDGWGWSPCDYSEFAETVPLAICRAFLAWELEEGEAD